MNTDPGISAAFVEIGERSDSHQAHGVECVTIGDVGVKVVAVFGWANDHECWRSGVGMFGEFEHGRAVRGTRRLVGGVAVPFAEVTESGIVALDLFNRGTRGCGRNLEPAGVTDPREELDSHTYDG